jgi:hypothetical protein
MKLIEVEAELLESGRLSLTGREGNPQFAEPLQVFEVSVEFPPDRRASINLWSSSCLSADRFRAAQGPIHHQLSLRLPRPSGGIVPVGNRWPAAPRTDSIRHRKNVSSLTDDTLAAFDDGEFSRQTGSELDGTDGRSQELSDVLYEEGSVFDDDEQHRSRVESFVKL